MLHIKESCHTYRCVTSHERTSHVTYRTYKWEISRINESCHIRISLFIHMHESRMSHCTRTGAGAKAEAMCVRIKMRNLIKNESCHTWRSHVTHGGVMSCMHWLCHTYEEVMNESRRKHEWVMSLTNESWHTYAWVMSETWHTNWCRYESWSDVRAHKNASLHIRRSHVTHGGVMSHMEESCHVWIGCVTHMNKSWMSHGTNMNESWVSHGTQTDAGTKAEAMCLFIERLLLQVYSFAIHII